MRPAESACIFWTLIDAFENFRKFRRVVICYNLASNDAVASLFEYRFYTNMMNLNRASQTSLLASHLRENWP